MELLDQFSNPMPSLDAVPFNVIIPKPFSISSQPKEHLEKIRDEVMDKVKTWERRQSGFFGEYQVYADSWRMKPKTSGSKKPSGLFNSRSGETHRATETLATAWERMITASDQFFEAVAEGYDDFGRELTEADLYATEKVLVKQLRWSKYKEKSLRSLRSLGIMGTVVFEEPFISLPYGDGQKVKEYTDFVFRSLLKTGFDTSVYDIDMSDYIFTVDFYTKWRLLNLATLEGDVWDRGALENYIKEATNNLQKGTDVYDRVMASKQRAGYSDMDKDLYELISYHGRLDTENPVIQAYWESEGRQDDPKFCDFSVGILGGEKVVKFHPTQYGTWHSRFKVAHYKLFEDEPVAYGVGRIGRKGQRELDVTTSRANDILMFALYSMWKVGRYAGLKANQLNIKPWNIVELEDVNQLEPIRPDIQAIVQALAMMTMSKEDFRTTVGAATNLQAQLTKASATESAIAQNEAIRGVSVHAEIIAETFVREHIETMHLNNLNYLDNEIWVSSTGTQKPGFYNRNNLPRNIGFEIKTVTDKDFRPERVQRLLEALNLSTSIRNLVPSALNTILPLFEEYFRALGMNPRKLREPIPVNQQLEMALQRMNSKGGAPANEVAGEMAGEEAGSGANVTESPVGPVETSPNNMSLVSGL